MTMVRSRHSSAVEKLRGGGGGARCTPRQSTSDASWLKTQ
jgi:hypothetical protein